jgi:AraC family ethanolamine operon transcriptional activator
VFDSAGDFRATAQAGFGAQLCSISDERLAGACAELGLPEPDHLLGRTAHVFECPADSLGILRTRLRQLASMAETSNPGALDHAANEIASHLVQAAAAGRELRPRIDPRRSQRVLDEALAAIHQEPQAAHSVRALCERIGASERTLRHAFQRRFGVPTVTYLRSLRLNGARRELRDADPSLETVTRVAQRWNFRNAGDFAAHYTRLFGERPSETLRRPARG